MTSEMGSFFVEETHYFIYNSRHGKQTGITKNSKSNA